LERISEVVQAVTWWRGKRQDNDVVMMSLTVRHTAGDDLKALRQGVSEAWRRVQQSRAWRQMREECCVRHLIRGHDITWGDNGWHPHIHVMMLAQRPDEAALWQDALSVLWRHAVEQVMGAKHLPTKRRACVVEACHDASYVGRLGLEVSSPSAKQARQGHMAPMQVAYALAHAVGEERDRLASAWRAYAIGMQGCHQLQWSRGLREALGEPPSDQQIVANDVDAVNDVVIAEIPQETWRSMALLRSVSKLDALGRATAGQPVDARRDALLDFFEGLERHAAECEWVPRRGTVMLHWRE
jgi:hypothetical protein